jgi:uncharacterized protein YciI
MASLNRRLKNPRVAWATAVLLIGCTAPRAGDPTNPETLAQNNYILAFLTTGPQAEKLDAEAVAAASTGHRAHIESMGAAGTLLLAGPFGEPRADPNWRGIYVFDLPDIAQAELQVQADPSVEAGLFAVTLMPWRSNVDLRPMRDRLEKGKAAGDPFVPAGYVLAIGEPVQSMPTVLQELAGQKKIICAGQLGGSCAGQFMILLSAETVEIAQAWLSSSKASVNWEYSSLWATALLGDLAKDS